jgi:hypothetical protein
MKRPPFSAVLLVVAMLAIAVFVPACGTTGGETTVPSLATTSVTPMEDGPPTTAATSESSASSTETTGGQTSISTPDSQTTTVTTAAATSTSSTLAEAPTSSSVHLPPKPPSTLVIVKPTNLTLQPVRTWRLYQETDPFLYWDGPWGQYSHPAASGGGYKAALTDGRVGLTFMGQRVSLLCGTGPKSGKIRITLDYETVATVDLYANPYGFPGVIWTSGLLPNGAHVLQVAPAGTKNPQSVGFAWDFDAVKIYGKLLEYTQD